MGFSRFLGSFTEVSLVTVALFLRGLNLVAEVCQSSEERFRHVLVEKDFHLVPATQNELILPTLR